MIANVSLSWLVNQTASLGLVEAGVPLLKPLMLGICLKHSETRSHYMSPINVVDKDVEDFRKLAEKVLN